MHIDLFRQFAEFLSSPPLKGHPYLDPGSGSFLIQLLIAGLVGAGFLVKTFWGRIISFFTGKKPDVDADSSVQEPPASDDDTTKP